jgi:hypothetical protein
MKGKVIQLRPKIKPTEVKTSKNGKKIKIYNKYNDIVFQQEWC